MIADFKEIVQPYAEELLPKHVVLHLLKDYKRPYDKINELVQKGELTLLKRGVYMPGPKLSIAKPASFLIANHLWGPSYVSLESALAHWGLIPERVYETTSVTLKESKVYKTPAGRFVYTHLPPPYYSFGIKRLEVADKQAVLIASPEKALCDKIVTTSGVLLRSPKQTLDFLTEDLRIDADLMQTLDAREIRSWTTDAPKQSSLLMLAKTLEKYQRH
ncbi:MAG: hypothetical protein MUD08_06245 [Cytophagales bacterium]|nr:hypothetical protein [Cytophagales bacterium]